MKLALAYVGDAVNAAGYRLAGAQCWSPAPGAESTALAQAQRHASVVLLSEEVARALPSAQLDRALAALQPLLVIVPKDGTASPLDPVEQVRAQLGLES